MLQPTMRLLRGLELLEWTIPIEVPSNSQLLTLATDDGQVTELPAIIHDTLTYPELELLGAVEYPEHTVLSISSVCRFIPGSIRVDDYADYFTRKFNSTLLQAEVPNEYLDSEVEAFAFNYNKQLTKLEVAKAMQRLAQYSLAHKEDLTLLTLRLIKSAINEYAQFLGVEPPTIPTEEEINAQVQSLVEKFNLTSSDDAMILTEDECNVVMFLTPDKYDYQYARAFTDYAINSGKYGMMTKAFILGSDFWEEV